MDAKMDGDSTPKGSDLEQNPYATPIDSASYGAPPYPTDGGYVRQVKPLSICMMVQGCLEVLIGMVFAVLAVIVPGFLNMQGGPQIPQAQQQFVGALLLAVYGTTSLISIVTGVLRFTAGWRGLRFKSRLLGVISQFLGLLNIGYCLPTSIGLCIWGCIIYFKPEVKRAFELGEEGYDAADIELGEAQRSHGS